MPAKSKAQQRLFGLVRAYQKGKVPSSKVSSKIKKIAKSVSPADAEKYASTPTADLKEVLAEVMRSPTYIEETLREIKDSGIPTKINGTYVDAFTSGMILTIVEHIDAEKKAQILSRPIGQMYALALKAMLHSNDQ